MQSAAPTVEAYLAEMPPERREAIAAVRAVVLDHLPAGYEEGMQYGMIGYYVPLARYLDTSNGQALAMAGLANQKRYMSLYLTGVYGDEGTASWFREAWTATGRRLDMGKSCVRFRRLGDVPLDIVGEAVARFSVNEFVAAYERSRRRREGIGP